MTTRAVHWYEGMFLRPQHFDAAAGHQQAMSWRGDRWNSHFSWGLRELDIDLDALADSQLVIHRLKARMRDGTLVSVPEDGALPRIDLGPALRRDPQVTAYLVCPIISPWRSNVAEPGSPEPVRYYRRTEQVEDLNTGGNPKPVEFRHLNIRVLLSRPEGEGVELLELGRFRRAARAEGLPERDPTYIPPLLACDAWAPLQQQILQSSYDKIGGKLRMLAAQAESRAISFDTRHQGDAQILVKIRELNAAHAGLGCLAFVEGLPPLTAYLELCRIVGTLAVFGPGRRVPELPRYDHDDLGGCFGAVKRHLDGLLDVLKEPSYDERPFVGVGLRMQVTLEPSWVEQGRRLYIGVRSTLPAEECVDLLTRPGRLDMKVGGSDQVDAIYRLGRDGLHLRHDPTPPRIMPAPPDTVFFRVEPGRNPPEWLAVQRSLTLAIRLNEQQVAGDVQGRQELTIWADSREARMRFVLYVVPDPEAAPGASTPATLE